MRSAREVRLFFSELLYRSGVLVVVLGLPTAYLLLTGKASLPPDTIVGIDGMVLVGFWAGFGAGWDAREKGPR